ncbi:sulfonate transport system substrate-binding protein [Pseudochelatococcus lubricantis]|uniref:Sulfonate transport system substrate-binding protein n=1 Tax=Pseudochelatococcus lubricantis TaxID=1538102 RepID=A0ABX0UY92_9HYPH|nr:ABC transporter substrate-binding protein [Pseudochelatococcus lubricantis]NIJ57919.1 sulfonate transport system substrate-binding protein [Pseudochelatococcus lubricantis]
MDRRQFLGGVAGATLVAVTGAVHAQNPLVVRIGFASIGVDNRPFSQGSSLSVSHSLGLAEKEFSDTPNVKIEWYFFRGAGPAVNEAVVNRQLDLYTQGDLPSIVGRANGIKSKILLVSSTRTPVYLAVPTGSDITKIEQLRGKRVAVFLGTNGHLSVAEVFAAHGLKWSDVNIVNLDNASTNAALATKDIDGAFGSVTFLQLEDQGLVKVVYNSNDDTPSAARIGSIFVTSEFEQAQPEIVARLVKAFTRGAHFASLEENRQAILDEWEKSGTARSILERDIQGVSLKARHSPLLDPFTRALYARKAEKSKEFGLIRRAVETESWFEPKYLEAAIKELGLEGVWTPFDPDGKPLG